MRSHHRVALQAPPYEVFGIADCRVQRDVLSFGDLHECWKDAVELLVRDAVPHAFAHSITTADELVVGLVLEKEQTLPSAEVEEDDAKAPDVKRFCGAQFQRTVSLVLG